MKLLNKSIKHLSISILGIVTIWSVFFYVNMLKEIKRSIDEGLENYKRIIIQNAIKDPSILNKQYFDESFFTIHKIDKQHAITVTDSYSDTILLMQDADDAEPEPEPVRMLITAFKIDNQYYQLKIANSMVEEDDLINELLWDVIWLYTILIIGIVFINNIVLKRLWKPFYNFLNQLKKFHLGKTQTIPETNTNIKEFTDLQKVVNTLLVHNIDVYEQQKEFIGNTSHELQTPLAIATNKLELLLEQGSLKDKEAKNITEIYQVIQRLVRLNKSLLLLTKIENKQFLDNQTISINTIVQQSLHDLEDIITFKNITVTVEKISDLKIQMDATLASIMISNLIKNATFHNNENGTISITIKNNSIKINNTGPGSELDKKVIFNRFYKSNLKKNNTGLGLTITKAIADLYAITINYHYKNTSHLFELIFFK
ncbi:HAMP domain-containing histidine kinase [Cellulophaga baltica]|uniref:sensor histidine kinase n=1 Tax=Cellulophaga TaxID=104264 RepID=UPI001C06E875|nr:MULTISPECIES: HAMP domain-containing sensor histidine kinase [Cellulophaga]MBU2994854.1 HAMP domain-containing histidine kinase [Cellulophaga baltica]MDO6766249.1 HAMP domain-containing sensor histidine kinase [Cellulophaga sp. 1_MG-2023]